MSKIAKSKNADIVNRVTKRLSPWYTIEWVRFDDHSVEGSRSAVAYVAGELLKFVPSFFNGGILVDSLVENERTLRGYTEEKKTPFAERIEKLLAGWQRGDDGELSPPVVRPKFEIIPPFASFGCTDIEWPIPPTPVKPGDKVTVKGVPGVVVRHPDDEGLAVISFNKQQPAPLEPLDAAAEAWQAAWKTPEPEYEVWDGWAYRLATQEDIGRPVYYSDYSLKAAHDADKSETTLTSFSPGLRYPYTLTVGPWKFAWVKEYPVQECEGRYWRSADEKDMGRIVLVSPFPTPRVEQGFFLTLTGIKRYDLTGARKTSFRCGPGYWSNAWVELKVKK